MNIGVDIDEVVAEFLDSFNDFLKNEKGILRTKEQYGDQNWFEWLPPEQKDQIVEEFRQSHYFSDMPVVSDAQKSLTELAKTNTIFFVTSRAVDIKDKTHAWLKNNFAIPHTVLHAHNHWAAAHKTVPTSKVEFCKQHNIDFIVEDGAAFSLQCANGGIPVILFDRPWNRKLPNHPLITRVHNWTEAIAIITAMKSNKIKGK